jgi:hypothetical protein
MNSLRQSSSLSSGIDGSTLSEEVNPMAHVSNMVDAMLVFACGLLLALITYWNLELPDVTQIQKEEEMTEVEDVEDITENIESDGTSYNELGTVYEDPETGIMYLIQPQDE